MREEGKVNLSVIQELEKYGDSFLWKWWNLWKKKNKGIIYASRKKSMKQG
jgi:hypothetical protein